MSRALFIGGPIDGQERVLRDAVSVISIASHHQSDKVRLFNPQPVPPPEPTYEVIDYHLLFAFGSPEIFIYSIWDITPTLLHLWKNYKHANSA